MRSAKASGRVEDIAEKKFLFTSHKTVLTETGKQKFLELLGFRKFLKEFTIINEDDAAIIPAKIVACTIIDLLADDAALAKKVISEFQPRMTKEDYLAYLKEMTVEKSY